MKLIFLVLLMANLWLAVQLGLRHPESVAAGGIVSPQQLPTANRLELLSEADPSELSRIERAAKKSASAPAADQSASLCTMVGPFGQLLQAEYLVERLSALGVNAKTANIEINDGEVYWLYLPPELSEQEAMRRLYELQSKNIESYVISTGELANGISFGQFSDSLAANARAEALVAAGYQVKIKAMPKTVNEIWVVLAPEQETKISESVWAGLLDQQQPLEKRQNFCSGVASQ